MFTTEKVAVRISKLQYKLKTISSYSPDNCGILFKYAIEFEVLLNALNRINDKKFKVLSASYILAAQRYCELGCEMYDESNRKQAFLVGKAELDHHINTCLRLLTYQRSEAQALSA